MDPGECDGGRPKLHRLPGVAGFGLTLFDCCASNTETITTYVVPKAKVKYMSVKSASPIP